MEKDYTLQNLLDICAVAEGENGKAVDLPRGIVARHEYGKIAFYRRPSFAEAGCAPEYPFGEGEFAFGKLRVRVVRGKHPAESSVLRRTLYIDRARLPEYCVLRTRKEGDVFQKFGSGTKKLKDYLFAALSKFHR